MNKLSDAALLQELQLRLSANNKSLQEMSDLTMKLQQVNAKLKESEKMKSDFLSNIRNEMNNPLAAILGLSKNILSVNIKNKEQIKAMAKLIHAEAFNLDFQLKNIFAAAELESGEYLPELMLVDINALIAGVIVMHKHRIHNKQLTVHNFTSTRLGSPPPASIHFKTDPAKLQLILSNILANAIEYSASGSELHIKAEKQDHLLSISIQDFGIGISCAAQENIFNRFTQLETGITKSYKGQGLGLSVCKALLEMLNGKIEVKSRKNEGSIFTVNIQEKELNTNYFATDGNEMFFGDGEYF